MTPKPWIATSQSPPTDLRIFKIRDDVWRSPTRDYEQKFITIDAPDWVNIVAITEDFRLVCVRQWRAGTNSVDLEIPGGMIDPGESPLDAGVRELLEETGYRGSGAKVVCQTAPNPAIMNNTCYTVFVSGCQRVAETSFDPGEEIEISTLDLKELEAALMGGEISHSLVVVALQHFLLYRKELLPEYR